MSKKNKVVETQESESVTPEAQPETPAAAEKKPYTGAKRGPKPGSHRTPQVNTELVLTFADGVLAAGGAQLTDKGWTVDGYTLADADGEYKAALELVATFSKRVAALRGLPVIVPGDYALSMRGHTQENQKAIFAYMTK